MGDLLADLLRQGGWTAVIVAVVASICIWGLAHFAAAPGTQVSVLWGLVQYTKVPLNSASLPPPPVSALPETGPMVAKAIAGSPLAPEEAKIAPIRVTYGITSIDDEAIAHSRSQEGLRTLRPLEEGKDITDTPEGTYYFSHAPETNMNSTLVGQAEKSRSFPLSYFEFRHRKDGTVLVVYTVENDANRLLALEGNKELSLVATGEPWQEFTSMVEIPVERVKSAMRRSISDKEGYRRILDIVVR